MSYSSYTLHLRQTGWSMVYATEGSTQIEFAAGPPASPSSAYIILSDLQLDALAKQIDTRRVEIALRKAEKAEAQV